MPKNSGPQDEEEQKKQREFQRRVLEHLKEHGPMNWNMLYVHFDHDTTAKIGEVLQELKQWQRIEVGTDEMVNITNAGLEQLKEEGY